MMISKNYPQLFVASGPPRLTRVFIGLSLALAVGCSSVALGQTFYPAPPEGFNAVAATDAELAKYGIPPRPDQQQPKALARWIKLVTTPQTRLENVTVETTNFTHRPAMNVQEIGRIDNNTVATTTNNWSGYAVTAPNNTFLTPYPHNYVYAEWVVPAVGTENCTYAPYASSQWVGYDGFNGNDVLQAGTAITACGTSYVAWYEWFTAGCSGGSGSLPCFQTNVSLSINAGDLVSVEVWYTTTAPHGHAHILNFNTGQSVSVGFDQPTGSSGSRYRGNTVEWVVERPTVSNKLVDLADYEATAMNYAHALGSNGNFAPASAPSPSTIYKITMTCPPWNPSSACKSSGLSSVNLYGSEMLWFFDEGATQ